MTFLGYATPMTRSILAALTVLLALSLGPTGAAAQNPFEVVARVGDRIVARYEVEQRALLLGVLNTPGDREAQAYDLLITERLQEIAARKTGVTVPAEDVESELAAFAGRFGLPLADLLDNLANEGIARETLRDFVRVQMLWRETLRTRFGPRLQFDERTVDKAIDEGDFVLRAEVALAEIVMPYTPDSEAQVRLLAEELARAITTREQFERSVMAYSASPSRERGGEIGLVPVANLPEDVVALFRRTPQGRIAGPLELPGALILFQVRGFRVASAALARPTQIDYARFRLPGGASEANLATFARLRDRVDTCNDLLAFAQATLPGAYSRETLPLGRVGGGLSVTLARLDSGEKSDSFTDEAGALNLVMVCARTRDLSERDRETMRDIIAGDRIETYGRTLLSQIRSQTNIIRR